MFERFTDRARLVVVLAQEEARMLNHNYIGTEHILLGLIHEGEGVAAKALESLGISLDAVRQQVEEIVGQGQQAPSGHIPFTPRAKKALELSLREALQLGHNYIGTEHILLGLIREGDVVAAQVLVKLGADLNRVRQQVIQLLHGHQAEELVAVGRVIVTVEEVAVVAAVQRDILDQIVHDLRNHRIAAKDARQMAKDFLALQLGPEPSDIIFELAAFSEKYPRLEPVQQRHLEFRALLEAISATRAEKEAAIDAQDFERAAHLRDREKQFLERKAEWPPLYPDSQSSAAADAGAALARYAAESEVPISHDTDQEGAEPGVSGKPAPAPASQAPGMTRTGSRVHASREHYADLDLAIRAAGDGSFTARVLDSPAGQSAEVRFRLPWSELELENFLLRIAHRPRSVRRIDSPQTAAVKEFGSRLYKALFDDRLEAILLRSLSEVAAAGSGLRIRLRLTDAPTLGSLPWEFLYDSMRNRFLCLSERTPVVRFLDVPDPPRPLNVSAALRILVVISSPSDLVQLDAEQEWDRLTAALAPMIRDGTVEVHRLERGTLAELRRALRQQNWNVLHFVGHGGFDASIGDGVLIFEDELHRSRVIPGQDLGVLLHDHDPLRLVVLNACEGARADQQDPFSGSAQGLVQQGIPAVIAMQFEFSDDAAITLASEMYGAICDGYSLEAAVTAARKAIFTDGNQTEWATPVLYLRTANGIIFNIQNR